MSQQARLTALPLSLSLLSAAGGTWSLSSDNLSGSWTATKR